jgi:DNA modification methylase
MAQRREGSRSVQKRPLLAQGGGRRSLTNVGGAVLEDGDPRVSRQLAGALSIEAGQADATLTHPFHVYPARMHPEIARRVLKAIDREKIVLDPFCGSGTVLVEAYAQGLAAIGTDLSPFAVELAKLKTKKTSNGERKALVTVVHQVAREAREMYDGPRSYDYPAGEEDWFALHTLRELACLTTRIEQVSPGFVRDALRMLLSSVLVKLSKQRSDSDPTRIEKPVHPGATFSFFSRKSFELVHALAELSRTVAQVRAEHAPVIVVDDATSLRSVRDSSVDVVLTSPPYAANYDYVAHHARRYVWLNLDAETMAAKEMGAARWFAGSAKDGRERFDRELAEVCASLARVVRPGGIIFLLLADGCTQSEALFALPAIKSAIVGTTLSFCASASQDRPVFSEEAQRAFQKTPRREHLIALKRAEP